MGIEQNGGVYAIVNKIDNKIYIGSTRDFKQRFLCHEQKLKSNNHYSKLLQKDWNNYGEKNFEFQVVEIIKSKDKQKMLKREQVYINKYDTKNVQKGYNTLDANCIDTHMYKLKEVRKKQGYTAKEMAININISLRAYESYEQGTREPKLKTLKQISSILGCKIDDLI